MKDFKNPFADPNLSYKGKTAAERGAELIREQKKRDLEAKLAEKRRREAGETEPETAPETTTQPQGNSQVITGKYILMPEVSPVANAIHALRESCEAENNQHHPQHPSFPDGSKIYRPLSFKETIEARVNDYESTKPGEERLRLFQHWIDSCTAVAYKAGANKFKIVPISGWLVNLTKDFNESFLPVDYAGLLGTELDSTQRGVKYNAGLTKAEIETHPAWKAAVEDDVSLLRNYRDIVFAEKSNPQKAMGFYLRNTGNQDGLRALYVGNLGYDSYANGGNILNYNGSFLRVAQPNP